MTVSILYWKKQMKKMANNIKLIDIIFIIC